MSSRKPDAISCSCHVPTRHTTPADRAAAVLSLRLLHPPARADVVTCFITIIVNDMNNLCGCCADVCLQPSNDLRELAGAQLQSLFQVLRRVSPGSHNSCKACVYARRADSLDAPQMKLQRVACCKSAQLTSSAAFGFSSSSTSPGSNNSLQELDEVLTLHRAAWEPGSSSGGSSGCETEALLINEEIVLLPSSNLLVLPLAEAGVLVGLLVVEVHHKPGSPVPHQPQPLEQQQDQQGQPVWELPLVLGLSEDVLWALRMCVGPLAKACAMDLRTALAGAQQEARQRCVTLQASCCGHGHVAGFLVSHTKEIEQLLKRKLIFTSCPDQGTLGCLALCSWSTSWHVPVEVFFDNCMRLSASANTEEYYKLQQAHWFATCAYSPAVSHTEASLHCSLLHRCLYMQACALTPAGGPRPPQGPGYLWHHAGPQATNRSDWGARVRHGRWDAPAGPAPG